MIPPAAASDFLARSGWAGAHIVPLAGDASFRRYFRAIDGERRAVLMDAPPPHEDPRRFLEIANHLRGLGFGAPEILAFDLDVGLVLLEDFGDDRMREHVDERPAAEIAVYTDAVALLAELHRHPAGSLPHYSRAELHREVALFIEWYCPAVGLTVDIDRYHGAWDAAFDQIADHVPVTVLRDYHAENIMMRGAGMGLGLLDFQDALVGHPAYDLVSLLQDARRDVAPALEAAMRDHYAGLAGRSADFDTAYAILGAQRNTKILGIFTRLSKRDGKTRYLDLMPRVWTYLERDLEHPALHEFATWFAANLPIENRAMHWGAR